MSAMKETKDDMGLTKMLIKNVVVTGNLNMCGRFEALAMEAMGGSMMKHVKNDGVRGYSPHRYQPLRYYCLFLLLYGINRRLLTGNCH